MYEFLDLTPEQQLSRRQLLDYYGFLAQVSVLIPLLIVVCWKWTSWILTKYSKDDAARSTVPSSPYAKAARLGHGFGAAGLKAVWRRLVFWCGGAVEVLGWRLGTKGEVLGAVAWTGWLVALSFVQTGTDYLHLTKRFGIVGGSQLPFHYLLSIKSPYSPLQLLTGHSHQSLISIHQALGRIITALFWAHAILYLNFYVLLSILASRLKEFFILCGIFAIVAFTVVGTTALKPLRDWSYRVFYITHVTLATILLPTLYFHVHHIRPFVYEAIAVYAVNVVLRWVATRSHPGTIKQISANLVEVTVPLSKSASRWQPGQHAYVSLPGFAISRTFRSNPFTVASIPAIDGQLRFVARVLDGNTAKLARQSTVSNQQFTIEGPYGSATHSERLLSYDRVLFVAGGVGATFIAPLYRQLLADLSPSLGSYRRQKVTFIWTARSIRDVDWALPTDEKEREGFIERLVVYLTRDVDGAADASNDGFAVGEDEEDAGPGEEGVELEERKTLLVDGEGGVSAGKAGDTARLSARLGRPDLVQATDHIFAQSNTERIAVVVCGPIGLSRSLRKAVGRHVKRGRDVWLWEEVFGL